MRRPVVAAISSCIWYDDNKVILILILILILEPNFKCLQFQGRQHAIVM